MGWKACRRAGTHNRWALWSRGCRHSTVPRSSSFFYTRKHAAEMAARVAFRPTVVGAVVGSFFSLNLSFSWMAVKRNAKDAEADFFYFFPHDSDGGRTAAARRVSSSSGGGGGRRVARGMMWVVGTFSPPPPPWVTRRSSAQKTCRQVDAPPFSSQKGTAPRSQPARLLPCNVTPFPAFLFQGASR